MRTPQGRYKAAVGTTELGAQTPPAADTHFRIASNTKTMTAALIVLLAQDGKLKFSDPVSAYVPGVPNGENITVADLLKMRSGLYGYTADPELSESSMPIRQGVDTAGGVGHRVPAFRRSSRPTPPTSTTTPTTRCWVSSPRRSAGVR